MMEKILLTKLRQNYQPFSKPLCEIKRRRKWENCHRIYLFSKICGNCIFLQAKSVMGSMVEDSN